MKLVKKTDQLVINYNTFLVCFSTFISLVQTPALNGKHSCRNQSENQGEVLKLENNKIKKSELAKKTPFKPIHSSKIATFPSFDGKWTDFNAGNGHQNDYSRADKVFSNKNVLNRMFSF